MTGLASRCLGHRFRTSIAVAAGWARPRPSSKFTCASRRSTGGCCAWFVAWTVVRCSAGRLWAFSMATGVGPCARGRCARSATRWA
eukprot:11412056-Alexandrium_andersonii.AAC.1